MYSVRCFVSVWILVAALVLWCGSGASTADAYYYDNYCGHDLTAGSYCNSHPWSLLRLNEGTSIDGGSVCVKAFHYPSGESYGDYVCSAYYARHCYSGTQDAYGRLKNGGSLTHPYDGFALWLMPDETYPCGS